MRIIPPSKIKSLRSKTGLTQEKLAERTGVTQAYIAKIESGKADPKISALKKISKALQEATSDKETTAEQVMTSSIISVNSQEEVKEAIRKMESHDISQIPVLKKQKQIGSLTEDKIVHEIHSGKKIQNLFEKKVREVMEDPFPTVGTNTNINPIISLLEHSPAVLVLEKGNATGIITKVDLLELPLTEE